MGTHDIARPEPDCFSTGSRGLIRTPLLLSLQQRSLRQKNRFRMSPQVNFMLVTLTGAGYTPNRPNENESTSFSHFHPNSGHCLLTRIKILVFIINQATDSLDNTKQMSLSEAKSDVINFFILFDNPEVYSVRKPTKRGRIGLV